MRGNGSHARRDKVMKEYGMIGSTSRKGNCWDNAPTESWFNSSENGRGGIEFDISATTK